MFLSDHVASFARKPKKTEEKSTLREKIIGRTNAGKAFRVGALASGLGLVGLALKNREALGKALKQPKEFYTKDAGKNPQRMVWYDKDGNVKQSREMNPPKDNPSFLSSGRKVNWDKVGKTVAIGGGALALPTTLAYVAGSKKDKEDIKNRVDKTWGQGRKTAGDVRTWVNTLHRVSR